MGWESEEGNAETRGARELNFAGGSRRVFCARRGERDVFAIFEKAAALDLFRVYVIVR